VLANESRKSADAYSGGDMLDIGAFHGWYSVLLAPHAHAGDRFISFEPDIRAIPSLRATLADLGARFSHLGLDVVTDPVGDGARVLASWPAGEAGHPSFANSEAPDSWPSLTIDQVVNERGLHPRFVKIDVEGAEWFVLQGMLATMQQHRPTIMLEVHPTFQPDGITTADVENLIGDNEYDCQILDDAPTARRCLWIAR
jgi:FkbM family methyltransferase